jgi:ABC-type polysaccharide/polyol phosphate transport system ATPase subunit
MQPSIALDQVSKRYRIGRGLTNLRNLFSIDRNVSNPQKYHWAVKDVSFALEPGEALGIIGPNGAGKTTLLKLLSHVTKPTDGSIRVNGRLSALIELGAGFHPDLSGRDNIYLNGTILGMQRLDIKSRFDAIVNFAGIGEYLDTPVKRYSSGMYARLGFAIAAHVDPQILLVDEVLAVGDYAFQQRCYARMDELRSQGTSLILVSHNMEAIRRVCGRGLVMYRGEDIFDGPAAEAVVAYSDALREAARVKQLDVPVEEGIAQRVMTFDAEIENVSLQNERGDLITVVESGECVSVAIEVRFKELVQSPIFSLTVRTPDGQTVYDTTTRWMNIETPVFQPGTTSIIKFALNMCLLAGEYELGVDIASSNFSHLYDSLENAMGFSVVGANEAKGLSNLGAKFSVLNESNGKLNE